MPARWCWCQHPSGRPVPFPSRGSLGSRTGGWGLGTRGKLRRFDGDRSGLADLVAAGHRYLQAFNSGKAHLLTAANLYRVAGDVDEVEPLLYRLEAELTASVSERGPDAVRAGRLVYVQLLLRQDEQVPRGMARPVHRWTLQESGEACQEAVTAFDKGASKVGHQLHLTRRPGLVRPARAHPRASRAAGPITT